MSNIPEQFINDPLAPFNDANEPLTTEEMAEYIDDNIDLLREYHADHIAPSVLDDDLPDAFDAWVVTLSEAQLLDIVNK